jgi:hypothetical protein
MPCNEWEEDQVSEKVHSVRRRQKKCSKRGVDLEESDDEEMNSRNNRTDELGRRVTGERAVMESESIIR